MYGLKNLLSPCMWNNRARLLHGNIAKQRCTVVTEGDVCQLETSNLSPACLDVRVRNLIHSHTGVIDAQVDSPDGGTRKAVSYGVVLPRHMPDVRSELRNKSKMTAPTL